MAISSVILECARRGADMERKVWIYGFAVLIISILLGVTLGVYFQPQLQPPQPQPQDSPKMTILPRQVGDGVFSCSFKELLVLEANSPQYELPLDLSAVLNGDEVVQRFNLDEEAIQLLRNNGFVALSWSQFDQFDEVYDLIDQSGIPVFVSADSTLHAYHVFFDEILRSLEEKYFAQNMSSALKKLVDESIDLYNVIPVEDETLKKASENNICFFSVAAKLLDPDFEVSQIAEKLVSEELELIMAHEGIFPSPLFGYEEDYSQYVPRGHYTRSLVLEQYFRAMMWIGRMRFEVKSEIQTVQAVLVTASLNEASEAKAIWEKVYAATAFFVGFPDDLTIYDYEQAVEEVYGEGFALTGLEDEVRLTELQGKLKEMDRAKIVSSPVYPEEKEELVGLRFMGQRFIPDSYMFQELVFSKVEGRLMPKGLDVMAVLGSQRAETHLNNDIETYPGYEDQLTQLQEEFSKLTTQNWTQNLYWNWLYSIESTLPETLEGYPTFMTTAAWMDEKLNTALGSWTELRHDTILYAKQSYTELTAVPQAPPAGYVEPLPQLYSRLMGLCNMTMSGLKGLDLLDEVYEEKLLQFRGLLETLTDVSVKELNGEALSEDDIQFIRSIGHQFGGILEVFTVETQRSMLVADVHTDPNTGTVLEEGCGYIDIIIVIYESPEGELIATAGPIFSYYEFTQPLSQRLTDEAWIEMLEAGEAPPRPEWINSFYS
jgi:hypothetical protein